MTDLPRRYGTTLPTPLGPLTVTTTDAGLVRLAFDEPGHTADAHPHLGRAADELARYFDGQLDAFTVPLDPTVGTPFQRSAWAYLRTIPSGQTRTYGQQAAAIGNPTAARAVGRANGANPLCLIIPCHRVVGRSGDLTGFAHGTERKRWLLDHERRHANLPT